MKRFAIVCLAIAAVAAGNSAAAGAPRAQLAGFGCQRAPDPLTRAVEVTAVMRPLAGTRKLELRFDLLRRLKGTPRFVAVHGGDLGKWVTPTSPKTLGQLPGDVWQYRKQVVNLVAPALYRFRVHFRWIGTRGQVLGTLVRLSQVCYQPELRPDLLVQAIKIVPPTGGTASYSYVAVIRNRGATGAGPFDVQLSIGPRTKTVQWLGAHSRHRATFAGPACAPGSDVTATVDPGDQVDDYDRTNNALTAACP